MRIKQNSLIKEEIGKVETKKIPTNGSFHEIEDCFSNENEKKMKNPLNPNVP